MHSLYTLEEYITFLQSAINAARDAQIEHPVEVLLIQECKARRIQDKPKRYLFERELRDDVKGDTYIAHFGVEYISPVHASLYISSRPGQLSTEHLFTHCYIGFIDDEGLYSQLRISERLLKRDEGM